MLKTPGLLASAFGAAMMSTAVSSYAPAFADPVEPPQGYLSIQQNFGQVDPVYHNGTQNGFFNIDYGVELGTDGSELAGTFWANEFKFKNSDASDAFPENYVGGLQGGYLGLQAKSAAESIATFSIWWALDARPGPGAECVDAIEMWYNDDQPFVPAIDNVSTVDHARQTAGGPFRSCRLPIELSAEKQYKLRIWQVSDATQPDAVEWWGAWLINGTDGVEHKIGEIQVPGNWGWIDNGVTGFVEHFGPMPEGCGSIPASKATFKAAKADNGAYTATTSADLYGACKDALLARTNLNCTLERCDFEVASLTPLEPEPSASADLLWRHTNGQVHYWTMKEGTRTGGLNIHTPVGPKWTVRGMGDVDGNGTEDIVWQHDNGQVHYWPMNGDQRVGGINVHTPVGAAWTLSGVGDVDGDGTDDLVWRHSNGQVHYWPMKNGQRTGGKNIWTPVGAAWDLESVGDVDGDGTDDIVWRHSNGQVHYWPMSEGLRTGGINVFQPIGPKWTLHGVGDVDGNGTEDIVWQHDNGQVHYWPMTEGQRTGGVNVHTPVGPAWTLAAVGNLKE